MTHDCSREAVPFPAHRKDQLQQLVEFVIVWSFRFRAIDWIAQFVRLQFQNDVYKK